MDEDRVAKQKTEQNRIVAAAVIGVIILLLLVGQCSKSDDTKAPPPAADASTAAAFVSPPTELVSEMYTAVAAPGAGPTELKAASAAFCGDQSHCHVMVWRDASNVPKRMPMLSREADALAFDYQMDRGSGEERGTWDCRIWPGTSEVCIADTMGDEPNKPVAMGSAVSEATQVIAEAGHECGTVKSADRLEDGSIKAVCTNGERYRVMQMENGAKVAMKCSAVERLGVTGC